MASVVFHTCPPPALTPVSTISPIAGKTKPAFIRTAVALRRGVDFIIDPGLVPITFIEYISKIIFLLFVFKACEFLRQG